MEMLNSGEWDEPNETVDYLKDIFKNENKYIEDIFIKHDDYVDSSIVNLGCTKQKSLNRGYLGRFWVLLYIEKRRKPSFS